MMQTPSAPPILGQQAAPNPYMLPQEQKKSFVKTYLPAILAFGGLLLLFVIIIVVLALKK